MCLLKHEDVSSDPCQRLIYSRLLKLLAASCGLRILPNVMESGQLCSMQIWLRSVNEINHVDKTQGWCLSQLWLKTLFHYQDKTLWRISSTSPSKSWSSWSKFKYSNKIQRGDVCAKTVFYVRSMNFKCMCAIPLYRKNSHCQSFLKSALIVISTVTSLLFFQQVSTAYRICSEVLMDYILCSVFFWVLLQAFKRTTILDCPCLLQ